MYCTYHTVYTVLYMCV
jgi:hypothetical protein